MSRQKEQTPLLILKSLIFLFLLLATLASPVLASPDAVPWVGYDVDSTFSFPEHQYLDTGYRVVWNADSVIWPVGNPSVSNGCAAYGITAYANWNGLITPYPYYLQAYGSPTTPGICDITASYSRNWPWAPITVHWQITITNVNETPTDLSLSRDYVAENKEIGTIVGFLSNTDPDVVENYGGGTYIYSVVTGPFDISGNNLTTNAAFNYESQNSQSVTVRVTDPGGLSFEKTFPIQITNVNEAPEISTSTMWNVTEDQTAHLTISAVDPEGDPISYSIAQSPLHGSASIDDATLTYIPTANYNGGDSLVLSISDGVLASAPQLSINVVPVNDAPDFTAGADQTINEDAPAQTVANWAQNVSTGPADEVGQTLTYEVVNNTNPGLFEVQPAVDSSGNLTFTSAGNANGSAKISLMVVDNGGTANSGKDTGPTHDFTITANPVNDPPSFNAGYSPTVLEDSGLQNLESWVENASAGPADEAGQTLTFSVTDNTNPGLFSKQPSITPAGVLSFEPAPNSNGSAEISVIVSDSGGTANGGSAIGLTQTFMITIAPVNDAPTFSAGSNQTVNEDAAAQTVIGWAQSASTGPANESEQLLSYKVVSNSNPELFSSAPTVNANGVLQYTVAPDANGSATIELQVSDNGGTINNGVDTGNTVTFTITVNPINDPPSFSVGTAPTVLEDSGAQTFTTWTQNVSQGPTNEVSQTLIYTLVSNTNPSLFSSVPAVSSNGTLTFTPAANANGSSTIGFSVTDNGGTASGGNDTGPTQTFVITVTPVNDPPTFSAGISPVIPEDSTAQTIVGWPQSVSLGAADESAQVLTYTIQSNSNSALFTVQPAVDSNGVLTFTPKANAHGTSSLSVSVVDSGGNSNGGSAAGPTRTISITLNPVNDAPVMDSTGSSSVTSINEDDITNSGMLVSALLATGAGGSPVSDVDDNVLEGIGRGIVVIESSQDAGHGAWQYSLDGSIWLAFGTPSSSAARLLDVSARVRFVPEANWNGSIGQALTYRAWDEKPGSGANGDTADITIDGPGGTSAFSASYEIASFTVLPINDAPLLDTGGVMKLDIILEDQPINGGTSVAAIVASAGGDRISEVSYEINPLEGIAVTAADNSQGAWQYSLNNGLDWTDFGTPDAAHARLLVSDTNTKIRFLPSLDWSLLWENAALPAITFQAWDRISGVNGGTGDASQNGLTTAYSTDSTTASITVTGRNDAPTFSKGVDITFDEGALAQTLPAWVTSISAGPADEVAKPQEQTVHFNIVYNTNPSLFTVVPAISPTGELTFTPEPQAYGTATIIFELQDSGGTGSNGTDTSPLAFFVIELREVNDPPVFTPGADQSVAEDSGAQTVSAWASAISAGPANEIWQDLTFVVLSNSNLGLFSTAPAISPTGALTYTPAANANGSATLTVYLHDGGGSLNGGTPDSSSSTFTITVTPVNNPPTNTVLPLISGQAYVNQVLSVTSGTWNDAIDIAPGTLTYNYQWQAADDASGANLGDIAGASANQYSVELAQANRYLRVKVTATDNGEGVPASQSTIAYSAYVRVEGVNPAASASGFSKSLEEDTALHFSLADFNANFAHSSNQALERIRLTALPQHGSLFLDANRSGALDSGEGVAFNQEILAADLGDLVYLPGQNWYGTDGYQWNATNALADGYPLPGAGVPIILVVAAVNDPVSMIVPGLVNIQEDGTSIPLVYTLGDVDVALADPASSGYEMSLNARFGTIQLASTQGVTFFNGSVDRSKSILVNGTLADLQAAFNGALFTPQNAYTGQDTIYASFKDNGATGFGVSTYAVGNTTIIVSDINNAPVNSLPAPFTVDTNTISPTLDFSFDDDSNSFMQFTFSANHGGINLPDTKALTLVSGANNSHAMTYYGPVLKVVKALIGLHYTPDKDYAGPDTITYTSDDLGGTGTGGAKTDTETLAVVVNAPAVGTADSVYLPANSVQTSAAPGVLANDSDINLDPLTVEVVTAPAYGTLDLKSNGSYTYTPPKGLTGLVTFTYRIYDGRLYSESVTASFHLENDLETHLGSQSSGDLVTFTYTAHNPAAQSTFTNLTSSFKVPAGVEVVNLTHGVFTPDPSGGGTISADPQASLLPGETFSMSWTLRRSGTTPITGTWETRNDRTSDSGSFAEALKTMDEDTYQELAAELGANFSSSNSRTLGSVKVTTLPQHGMLFVDANGSKMADAGESVALNEVVAAVDLPALGYLANANWHGTDAWGWQPTYALDAGTAAIGPETVMTLTVQAVNDTPQVTAPAKATILEGTSTDPLSFDLQDIDTLLAASEAQDYAMTLESSHGTIALGSANGLTFVSGADKTKSIGATASLSALRVAVQGLVYTPDGQYNGSDSITLTLKDAGNSGSGGEKTAQDSVVIEIQSANNAPVNSLPASLVLDVDTQSAALTFGFSDDSTDQMQFSMTVEHGSVSVGDPSSLTLVSGANHSPALSYSGSVAAVQAVLGAVRYQPDAGYVGVDTLVFTTDDLGGSGFGGPLSDTDNLSIKVNGAPVGVDDSYYLPANSTLTISAPGVKTNDTDVNTDTLTVSLVSGPAYGTLDLKADGSFSYAPPKGLTGLVTFSYKANDRRLNSPVTLVSLHIENDLETHLGSQPSGDLVTFTFTAHNPDAQSTFSNLNSSFKIPAGVEVVNLTHGIFTPDPAGGGTISADPQSSLLPGESFSMSWTLRRSGTTPITGTWETSNDRTSDSGSFAEAQKTLDEDTYLVLAAELGASFTSSNTRSLASIQLTTLPQHGTLFVDANGSKTADAGEAVAINQVVVAVDLPGLGYLADANWHGADAWGWQPAYALDAGTSAIGPETVMTLTVQAVNDAPQVTAPAKVTTLEGAPTSPMTFDLQDVDTLLAASAAQDYAMTLACSHGSIALDSTSGLTFVSGSDKTKSIAVTASLSALRLAAQGLVYTPEAQYDGTDILTLTLKDAGNSGSGGEKTAQGSVAIEVLRVNRAPVNSLPASLVLDADTQSDALTFGFSDDSTEDMQFSLSAAHGSLSVDSPDLLTLDSGANHSHSLTYHGPFQAVRTALSGIRYQPDSGYFGPDEITFATNDLGSSGFGGPMGDSDPQTVKVNAAPISGDDTYTAIRGTVLSLPAGALLANDTDANLDALEARLVDAPPVGILSLNADGGFTYTPPALFDGDVSFSYAARDGRLLSSKSVVTLHVIKDITHVTFTVEGGEIIYTFNALNPTDNQTFNDLGILFNLPEGAELITLDNGIYTTCGDGHGIVSSNSIPSLKPGEQYQMTWRIKARQGGIVPGTWTITHDGASSTGTFNISRNYLPLILKR